MIIQKNITIGKAYENGVINKAYQGFTSAITWSEYDSSVQPYGLKMECNDYIQYTREYDGSPVMLSVGGNSLQFARGWDADVGYYVRLYKIGGTEVKRWFPDETIEITYDEPISIYNLDVYTQEYEAELAVIGNKGRVVHQRLFMSEPPKTPKWIATYQDGHTTSAECDDTGVIKSKEIPNENLVFVDIKDCVTSIGNAAFQSCTNLTSIDIPNSVTRINSVAFNGCTSLTSIDIPNSVTRIDIMAFRSCTSLQSITINATTPPTLGSDVFTNTNDCPIYVPAESVDVYKSAWSSYADWFNPISI